MYVETLRPTLSALYSAIFVNKIAAEWTGGTHSQPLLHSNTF